jgi:hypothetical protein
MKGITTEFRTNLLLVALSAVTFYCATQVQGMWHQACVDRVLKNAPHVACVSLHVPPLPQVVGMGLVFAVAMVIHRKKSRLMVWATPALIVAAGIAIDWIMMMAAYAWIEN